MRVFARDVCVGVCVGGWVCVCVCMWSSETARWRVVLNRRDLAGVNVDSGMPFLFDSR